MTIPETWMFEALKLIFQFVGALAIAWFAVKWALRRYKLEKSWEKRLQAYIDVVIAIGEMQNIQRYWMQEFDEDVSWTREQKEELSRRYAAAFNKLEEARAMATLLLPNDTASTIVWIFSALDQLPEHDMPDEQCYNTLQILSKGMESVLQQGRKSLGVHVLNGQ